jgi:AraC-like DNA-binding protein/Tfp pilus assembly protein PilF
MPVIKYFSGKIAFFSYLRTVFFVLLLLANYTFAQNKSYDEVLYQAVVKTAGTDINLARKMADSLYSTSTEPLHKVKSLMLLSELDLTTGRKKEGIKYALQAEEIASESKLYEWQARIYGFIATHYRSIGFKKQSKLYLKKGLEAISNVEDIHIVNQYKALVYQELALYDIEDKQYTNAISTLKKAEPYFNYIKNKELRLYQLATNFGQLGRAYLDIKDTKTAVTNFKKALRLLSQIKHESTIVKGFMYEGLGRAFLEEDDLKKAKPYLDKALMIADASRDMSLNEEVYCDLAIYYMEADDIKSYNRYNKLFQTARENSVKANKESAEVVVNRLEDHQREIEHQHTLWFAGLSLASLTLVFALVLARAKRKKEYANFQQIIKNIYQNIPHLVTTDAEEVDTPSEVPDAAILQSEREVMPKEVEQTILDKLLMFEQGIAFTDGNLNLSVLSVMLETNSKYLSYVINKHKKKDFNNYINELRIVYIIKKLESSPEYLTYKISYLAEECGFSSHSKFAEKFKSATGMSPSSFIRFLHKEQQSKVA